MLDIWINKVGAVWLNPKVVSKVYQEGSFCSSHIAQDEDCRQIGKVCIDMALALYMMCRLA